jgi:hypothetical protein
MGSCGSRKLFNGGWHSVSRLVALLVALVMVVVMQQAG